MGNPLCRRNVSKRVLFWGAKPEVAWLSRIKDYWVVTVNLIMPALVVWTYEISWTNFLMDVS